MGVGARARQEAHAWVPRAAASPCSLRGLTSGGRADGDADGESGTRAAPPRPDGLAQPETAPVADPEHAVDPPGPFAGALVRADILIYAPESLSVDVVHRIKAGSRASPTPSSSRWARRRSRTGSSQSARSTRRRTATSPCARPPSSRSTGTGSPAASWRSTRRSGKRLQDKAGFVKLGNDKDAPEVHVGAYAPQVPQIDAVVNEKWGEELGVPTDNALLINTGIATPAARDRKALQKIVGDDACRCSILGPDLDPDAQQIAVLDRRLGRRRRSARSRYRCSAAAGSRPSSRGSPPTSAPSRCRSSAASPATR